MFFLFFWFCRVLFWILLHKLFFILYIVWWEGFSRCICTAVGLKIIQHIMEELVLIKIFDEVSSLSFTLIRLIPKICYLMVHLWWMKGFGKCLKISKRIGWSDFIKNLNFHTTSTLIISTSPEKHSNYTSDHHHHTIWILFLIKKTQFSISFQKPKLLLQFSEDSSNNNNENVTKNFQFNIWLSIVLL